MKLENFFGLSFFFQQVLAVREIGRPFEVLFDRGRGVELYFDSDLSATDTIELPAIQNTLSVAKVKNKRHEPFTGLGADIYDHSKFSERQKSSNADIIHFACHAEDRQEGMVIRIADGYVFHNSMLPKTLNSCAHKPFLFLNACELAVRSIPDYNGLLRSLHDAGVKAVLATEIEVDDTDAAEFASKVYAYLFSTEQTTLQKAVFAVRWTMARSGNLIGLTYSYYGQCDLKVKKLAENAVEVST